MMTAEPGTPHKGSTTVIEYVNDYDNVIDPHGSANGDENIPVGQEGAIIRVNDPDNLETDTNSHGNTLREIPLVKQPKSNIVQPIPPVESIPDLIEKLATLKNAGIITEQEFDDKKAELLKRI
ncbi:MAG: SHOCT domain-containing protein [Methanoregula sp.]